MNIHKQTIFTIFTFFALTQFSSAQPARHCDPEFQRYCSQVPFDPEKMMACLIEHEKDASAECKEDIATIKEMKKKQVEFKTACQSDLDRMCSGRKGHEAVFCLKEREGSIQSNECKKALAHLKPLGQ